MFIPFKKYIICLLCSGKNFDVISNILTAFGFECDVGIVKSIASEIQIFCTDSIKEKISKSQSLDSNIEIEKQYLQHYEVLDLFEYINNNEKNKWASDCFWILEKIEITALINIFLFNDEPLDSISDIIKFRFKKKIGIDALTLYSNMFWDCSKLSAHEAMKFFPEFRTDSLIVRNFQEKYLEVEKPVNENCIGSLDKIVFQDVNYIKWKIGYTKTIKPDAEAFFNKVQLDCIMKYEEAKNMLKSISRTESSGVSAGVAMNNDTTNYHNLESERVKLMRSYFNMFIKAYELVPKEISNKDKEFFEKVSSIKFDFVSTETIVKVEDNQEILEDIKNDIN